MRLIKLEEKCFWSNEIDYFLEKEHGNKKIKLEEIRRCIQDNLFPKKELFIFFKEYIDNVLNLNIRDDYRKEYLEMKKQICFFENIIIPNSNPKENIGRGKSYWPKEMQGPYEGRDRFYYRKNFPIIENIEEYSEKFIEIGFAWNVKTKQGKDAIIIRIDKKISIKAGEELFLIEISNGGKFVRMEGKKEIRTPNYVVRKFL